MESISVKTSDDVKVSGRLFPADSTNELILHVPGMIGNAYSISYYSVLNRMLPENGIAFLTTETRTGTKLETIEKMYPDLSGQVYDELIEDSVLDLDAWVEKIVELGYEKIWLLGSSLGPAKVVNWFYQRKPDNIAGLTFLSPSDMLGLVNDPLGAKDHAILLPEAQKMISLGQGDMFLEHLLWDIKRMTASSYVDLFGDDSDAAVFNFHNPSLGWEKVNSISVPVLSLTGTEDDGITSVIDVEEAMKMLDEQLVNSPRKKYVIYDGANHNFEGFEEEFTREIIRFIRE